jgi:hypothetical protein
MDPLANNDLKTYIKNLVDRHLPGKDDQEDDLATRRKTQQKKSGDKTRPIGGINDKRVEKA